MSSREKARQIRRIQAEANVMSQCSIHPNITQFLGCHAALTKTNRPLMVMELMETSLFMALHEGKLASFSHRCRLIKGVASAMEFLHLRGTVHRDIKSMNILLTGKGLHTAKLADFGEAKEKGFATTHAMSTSFSTGSAASGGSVSGTIAYQSPEVLLGQVTQASRKAEIHTFGIVLWECLTGDIPHQGKGPIQLVLLAQDRQRESMLDLPDSVPPGLFRDADWLTLRNVARSCIRREAKHRPTASQVVAGLDGGPSYVFQTKPTLALLPGEPSVVKPVPQPSKNATHGTTLTIERRNKEQGRGNPWNVYYQGRVVQRLGNGASHSIAGLAVGGFVQLEVRGKRYTITVLRKSPTGGKLVLWLKHKVKIKSGFTTVGESVWIEPAVTGNEHLRSGYLAWSDSGKSYPSVVVPAAAPPPALSSVAPPSSFVNPPAVNTSISGQSYSAVQFSPASGLSPVFADHDDDEYDC